MLFNRYMEKLMGSKAKIKMLRAICRIPGKEWTSRELARFAGISHTQVLRSLGDLTDMNLLKRSKHGSVHLIALHKRSFMYRILKEVFLFESNTYAELIETLKYVIPKENVVLYALFGSVARHEEKPNSDIDVLIITEKKGAIEKIITEKQPILSELFGNELSPHIMTPQEFAIKKNTPFMKEIKKNHVILGGEWI